MLTSEERHDDPGSSRGPHTRLGDRYEASVRARLVSERLVALLVIASLMASDPFGARRSQPAAGPLPNNPTTEPLGAHSEAGRGV